MPSHQRTIEPTLATSSATIPRLVLAAALPLTSGSGEDLKTGTEAVITLCTVFVPSLTVKLCTELDYKVV
ncbi:hypothetical protein [Bradyrhizobium zhanjiangense]|uniref:hypothetical protein n=1 Tax=Bradyrhizobium zhanjiangense TaxID=1325107 RepID=UPI001008B298|nr:hypothetical protein [Bradyrhizobium zhanjiangense]